MGAVSQTWCRKLASSCWPCSVWTTSGWNWTPKQRRSASSMTATGTGPVDAVATKPGGRLGHRDTVAHPHVGRSPGASRESDEVPDARELGAPVLARVPCGLDRAAEILGEQLGAVADAEDRDPEIVDRPGRPRGAQSRGRLAGPPERMSPRGSLATSAAVIVADDLGVDVGLADAPRDELGVLGAEVDDEDGVCVGIRAQWPIPTPCWRWSCFPSVWRARRDHHLGLLELLHRLVPAGRHRGAERAEEVHAAVVLVRGAEQDLAQRAADLGLHPRARAAASGGTSPCPSGSPRAGRLDGRRERRAEHDGVGPAGDGLGDVAALRHAAVGDHVDVDARLVEVAHARPRHVGDRRRLGHADAEHPPRGAGVARADADEDADRAGAHQVQRRLVAGAATDDHRDVELADEPLEVERLDGLRDVLRGDDGALDHEDVELASAQDGRRAARCAAGSPTRRRRRRRL